MNTSVVKVTMTDGSIAYNVVFVDGSQKAVIACVDKEHARKLQTCIEECSVYAEINPV
jgi:hypothetical protein